MEFINSEVWPLLNSRVLGWNGHTREIVIPAESDGDLAAVAELGGLAGDGHTAESGAAEVKVGAAEGAVAAGALVGNDDGHGTAGADGEVQALDLVTGAAALASTEQHRTYRPYPRP